VRVVAAENFWGDIVRQIGGSHVSVKSIISDPSADPHQYESDARNAADVADARVVVVNGLGYDDFMSKLLGATNHAGRVVLTVADVLHVSGADANPHLWYDIPRISEVARAIESELAAADPADKAVFATNRAAFDASLEPLLRTIDEITRKYPGAPVAYTERVPQYVLDAAGLSVKTPPGFARAIEDGNEPSPGDAQTMYDLVTQHRIRVLLYNAQATSPVTQHVQDLARRAGIPVVAVTETLPHGTASYQVWQENQLTEILRALGG
jgi:zinc/manganese transport system substrate-binding protein